MALGGIGRAETGWESHQEAISGANWMSDLNDSLRLTELTIPGTHETMAFEPGPWDMARCQTWSLSDQLNWGVRMIDIRVKHLYDNISIWHSEVDEHALFDVDVLQPCLEFLDAHPTETILMRIQNYAVNDTLIKCFPDPDPLSPDSICDTTIYNTRPMAETLDSVLEPYLDGIWQCGQCTDIPTLGEVRGKIVILQQLTSIPDSVIYGLRWNGPNWSIQDDWQGYCCYPDDLWTGDKRPIDKERLVRAQLDTAANGPENTFYINFLSHSAKAPCLTTPHGFAWGCNQLAGEHVSGQNARMAGWTQAVSSGVLNGWFYRPLRLGAIMMDFIDEWWPASYYSSISYSLIKHNPFDFPAENPDWMSRIYDTLLLSEIAIPGTHGSMTYTADGVYKPDQILSLADQFKAGIRAIDVVCTPEHASFKLLYPGIDYTGMLHQEYFLPAVFGDDVLKPCVQFLRDHPSETILLRVKKVCFFNVPEEVPCDPYSQDTEWWETLLWHITEDGGNFGPNGEFVRYGDYVWQSDNYANLPTLGEVRGKIVILQDSDSPVQLGPLWSSFHVQENQIFQNWDQIREGIVASASGAADSMYVNYITSGSLKDAGGYFDDDTRTWQHGFNKQVYDFLWPPWEWESILESQRIGIIMMDYPGPDLIYLIIHGYNEQAPMEVDDQDQETLPRYFSLSQNYPNPFNPITTIEYSVPRRSNVKIEVLNMLGQKVRTLKDEIESPGTYKITWDGRSESGDAVSSGVYLYRFQTDENVQTRKMLLLK